MLKKIVFAGTQHPSFAQASAALAALAGLTIATKQVERVTEKVGRERVEAARPGGRGFPGNAADDAVYLADPESP